MVLTPPPHILMEIETIETEIKGLQATLKTTNLGLLANGNSDQIVSIQIEGAFSAMTIDRLASIVAILAGLLDIPCTSPDEMWRGTPRNAIKVQDFHQGNVIFYLGTPSDSV